jgi:hypothetical protein
MAAKPIVDHLQTYFLFPFSVDREAVVEDHQDLWKNCKTWIEGLDNWIGSHSTNGASAPVLKLLGGWKRDPLRSFDMDSRAYQEMVFFHPFVRRVFFDTGDAYRPAGEEREALVRQYKIDLQAPPSAAHEGTHRRRVLLEAEDSRGRSATVELFALRLLLFANGIGILSIGVEANRIPADQALWINEMMRKVYPSSRRQIREGRTPCRMALSLEEDGARTLVAEERFETGNMIGYLPPLSRIITSLLYFANYAHQEFEPVLDERMIVYTYAAIDENSVDPDYKNSRDYEVLVSRFLYVDRWGSDFRYDEEFIRKQMRRHTYRRWAHQGTIYGATSYSNVTLCIGVFECDEHLLEEGFLIKRMFSQRYYFMVLAALFYRATLLDFSERTAIVSRYLYHRVPFGNVNVQEQDLVDELLADFQFFSNHWYFSELANKDEEIEHFQMQVSAYRLDTIKREVESEIEKLKASMDSYATERNTDAVNRLAMLSMILGCGAVVTGFFGMNFSREFEEVFFNPGANLTWTHYASIAFVSMFTVGALSFVVFLVVQNWDDYRWILLPRARGKNRASLRRVAGVVVEESEES